jgi:hypothetical protein
MLVYVSTLPRRTECLRASRSCACVRAWCVVQVKTRICFDLLYNGACGERTNERRKYRINHACGWSGEFNLPNDDDDDEDDEDDDEKDDRANDGFCGWE